MENNVNTTENASNEEQSKPLKQGAVMRSLLWKIAGRIKDLQKKASEMTDEQKKNIAWEMLEVDWFDYLEEELSNWTEDFTHENGNYMNVCIFCKNEFKGHKRRVVCKVCNGA